MFYKPEFRNRLRKERKALNPIVIAQASKQVAAQLITLPQLLDSTHIGFYMPDEGELDPQATIQAELHQDKQFYLPVILEHDKALLEYFSYTPSENLVPNQFDILEPTTNNKAPMPTTELDLVLTPLVGFDSHCNRLGRGAGYYDRTFAFKLNNHSRPILVGLAYEFQKIENIEPNPRDVPLDFVVTEKTIYQRT